MLRRALSRLTVALGCLVTAIAASGMLFKPIPGDINQIKQNGYIEISSVSLMRCARAAAQKHGSEVFCHGQGDSCVVPLGTLWHVRANPATGWVCYKSGFLNCLIPNGSHLALFAEMRDEAQCATVCTLSGLGGVLPALKATPITCCSTPFTFSSAGCLLFNSASKQDWCGARDTCRWQGGFLFRASSAQHLSNASAIVRGSVDDAYVDVRRPAASWLWAVPGGRPVEAVEWDAGAWPLGGDSQSCGWVQLPSGKLRNDGDCAAKRSYLCQALVPAC